MAECYPASQCQRKTTRRLTIKEEENVRKEMDISNYDMTVWLLNFFTRQLPLLYYVYNGANTENNSRIPVPVSGNNIADRQRRKINLTSRGRRRFCSFFLFSHESISNSHVIELRRKNLITRKVNERHIERIIGHLLEQKKKKKKT